MHKIFTFLALILVFFVSGLFIITLGQKSGKECRELVRDREIIFFHDTRIDVEVSDTESERVCGLSYRDKLAQDSGMLFIFETPGRHGIWMKDMRFSLDILWLDEEGKVIHAERRVSQLTYPEAFVPQTASRYVLELPEGFIERNDIVPGDFFTLPNRQ